MRQEAVWFGAMGKEYTYEVYSLTEDLPGEPGNYIFAREEPTQWVALYVGQTSDLYTRLRNGHHKRGCAALYGLTHIHAHVNHRGEDARLAEEGALIANYGPECNDEA